MSACYTRLVRVDNSGSWDLSEILAYNKHVVILQVSIPHFVHIVQIFTVTSDYPLLTSAVQPLSSVHSTPPDCPVSSIQPSCSVCAVSCRPLLTVHCSVSSGRRLHCPSTPGRRATSPPVQTCRPRDPALLFTGRLQRRARRVPL